jgi:hypothetical protein
MEVTGKRSRSGVQAMLELAIQGEVSLANNTKQVFCA